MRSRANSMLHANPIHGRPSSNPVTVFPFYFIHPELANTIKDFDIDLPFPPQGNAPFPRRGRVLFTSTLWASRGRGKCPNENPCHSAMSRNIRHASGTIFPLCPIRTARILAGYQHCRRLGSRNLHGDRASAELVLL